MERAPEYHLPIALKSVIQLCQHIKVLLHPCTHGDLSRLWGEFMHNIHHRLFLIFTRVHARQARERVRRHWSIDWNKCPNSK